MFAYLLMGLGAALLITTGIAGCEHKLKKRAQAETARVTAEKNALQAEYDLFVQNVARAGEEREKENERIAQNWRAALSQQKGAYEKRLAVLRGERDDLARRVLDYYRAEAGAGRGEVPRDSGAAGAPGPGPADDVARRTLEALARDAQETTLMFLECRDSWRAMVEAAK